MAEAAIALEIGDPVPSSDNEKPATKKDQWICYIGDALLLGLCFVIFIPLYFLYAGVAWLFCDVDVVEDNSLTHDASQGNKSFYQKVQDVQETTRKLGKLPHVIQSRVVIFITSWIILNFSVPILRNKLVLGSKLWKWTLLVALISCGYHLISMINKFLICCLCMNPRFKKKKNLVYYVKGMRQSLNLVGLSVFILLTWVSYFRTSHGIKKTDDTDTILHVFTWSFVTFAVMAVLWLLKSVLLLKWEADAVYRRFTQRILVAGLKFYFLGHVCGWHLGVFKAATEEDKKAEELNSKDKEIKTKEKKKAKQILCLDKDATLYDIQKMTEYFVDIFKASSRDDNDTVDIIKQCRKIKTDIDATDEYIGVEHLVEAFELEEDDAEFMYTQLSHELNSTTISYKNFEKSMVKAQKNCVALGHTLSDAKDVLRVLNSVMIGLLFFIVFIAWLLLIDIATTKILVLIEYPLLAVTFIFGDTCKKIFEGIIFSFINHPFDVGDRCIIDKTEFEVRQMSVLTTTFVVIGRKEEALYPNSALATIPIVNLRGDPDPSDSVELTLDSNHTKVAFGK